MSVWTLSPRTSRQRLSTSRLSRGRCSTDKHCLRECCPRNCQNARGRWSLLTTNHLLHPNPRAATPSTAPGSPLPYSTPCLTQTLRLVNLSNLVYVDRCDGPRHRLLNTVVVSR